MRVLVVTETDSCCGPMAAAFLNDYSTAIEAVSVGRNPLPSVDALMVTVMKECLIDLSDYQPRQVSDDDWSNCDIIYECPEHSAPKTLAAYRNMRDFIKNEAYLFFRKL